MSRSCLLTAPDPGSSKTKRVRRESIVFPFNAKTSIRPQLDQPAKQPRARFGDVR